MKKALTLLIAIALMFAAKAQQNCQVNFQYQSATGTTVVNFIPNVFSTDSLPLTVTSWSWTFDGGSPATSNVQNPGQINFNSPGAHNVCLTIATSVGCTATYCDTVAVGGVIQPYMTVTGQVTDATGSTSADGAIDITVVGGYPPYTYNWSTGANTQDITGLNPGNYTVSVHDSLGNGVTASFVVSNGPSCTAHFTYNDVGNFGAYFNGTAHDNNGNTLNVTSWSWTFNGGTPATSSNQFDTIAFNSLGSHLVCLTISTANGCTSNYCDSVLIGTNINPNIYITGSVTYASSSSSSDGAINITVTGGFPPYTFLWSNGDTAQDLINLYHGTYTVTVTDTAGNSNTASFIVSAGPTCSASFQYYSWGSSGAYFNGNAYDVNGTSLNNVIAWSWTFSGGTPATATLRDDTVSFNTTGAHQVCLTIATSTGCTATYCDSVLIGGPCTLTATYIVTPVSVVGGNDGAINVTVAGGTPPYSYSWNTGATTQNLSGLSAGLYVVTIHDSNPNCGTLQLAAYIYDPNNPAGGPIVDTLFTTPVDTCFNAPIDTFYISQIQVLNDSMVTVTWIFSDSTTTYSLNSNYNYTTSGNQIVYLTIDCGNFKVQTTYMNYIHISTVTGINNISGETAINIYPNPVKDFLNISATLEKPEQLRVTIYNMNGQIIFTRTEKSAAGFNTWSYNLSALNEGLYMLVITSENAVIKTQKLTR